jgi:ABC-type glutathione transport system ATPase component
MESIDALAKAVNEYKGGLVLVSHDMRLISQVAKEIWLCEKGTITKYKGNIDNFKMDMRAQMGLDNPDDKGGGTKKLKGDASVKAVVKPKVAAVVAAPKPKLGVILPPSIQKAAAVVVEVKEAAKPAPPPKSVTPEPADDATATTINTASTSSTNAVSSTTSNGGAAANPVAADAADAPKRYIPPHLRKR